MDYKCLKLLFLKYSTAFAATPHRKAVSPCGKPRAQLSPLAYACSAEGYVISDPWERHPFARKEFAMLDNATLHDLILTVLYYASPLLLLAGVAGFATSMAMWFIRR